MVVLYTDTTEKINTNKKMYPLIYQNSIFSIVIIIIISISIHYNLQIHFVLFWE